MKIALSIAAIAASIALAPAPASAAHGDPSEWTWLGGDSVHTARWDPCTPITWSTPHDGSPTERAFAKGIRKTARFSGYTFQRVNTGGMITTRIAPADDATMQSLYAAAYAEIYGGVYNDGNMWAVRGVVVIGIAQMDPKWVDLLPRLFLHELGHIMGLGHVQVDQEIMTNVAERPNRLGAGDRAGLAAMKPITCIPALTLNRGAGTHIHRERVY